MEILKTRHYSKKKQYLISVSLVMVSAILCFLSVDIIGFRAVALILLLVVSLNAILFDIFPVMLSALLSALIWNFFFIPPILTFHIGSPEDALMFFMYFVIASINAVLTYKIREYDKKRRDEEEKANAIKLYNTLLNSLSHELRTPIATIIGAIDTINDGGNKLTDVNRKVLYSEIETAGTRLNRQVENLLSMSRLEAGFIKPKEDWCDLNELIFTTIKRNKENLLNHSIVFTPNEELPLFKLDIGLLEQVVHNIIHNAVQHTPKGSLIKIEAKHAENSCEVIISDNGGGFPIDKMEAVFNKFYRLNNNIGGTGLGLSIVKGFTEAMNGTIHLQNKTNGGAKFTIKIPAETTTIEAYGNQ
ncbi:sensor histidine kinase [Galbibacter orientalis]|uniref:sensor histidine kinase n=1 Tax=Galbibacter orientalis TaxID=453852 RepID=UPI0030806912